MIHISDIKLIRTDTTLDLSQKAEKAPSPLTAAHNTLQPAVRQASVSAISHGSSQHVAACSPSSFRQRHLSRKLTTRCSLQSVKLLTPSPSLVLPNCCQGLKALWMWKDEEVVIGGVFVGHGTVEV
ncbi:hypothetical protein WN944_022099 [Citrus x changshan-huyou]|uniref:Uncharacterized protein n=1 Tax=Citrus x changshan-huyou TaxID=2935761 RepID=A0AAP0MXX0_9ROSI